MRPVCDLGDLILRRLIRTQATRWNSKAVECDHIVWAFDDDEAKLRDRFAVARFLEPLSPLPKELKAAMETDD